MPDTLTTKQADLLSYRSQFDSLKNCHHLISNSLGAMPNRAAEQAKAYTDIWQKRGARAWQEHWWTLAREVGDKIGRLIGAPPDSVSMHPNVTSASATVLSCFDCDRPRNKVVMVEMEFPSLLYLYREWLGDNGKVEVVPCPDRISVPLDRLLDAIDEQTLLVPISHVLFRSSYIIDAAAIIERAHSVGAMVVLDIFQGIGTVPVDVAALGVDFAVGGCLKWLCGGPGACFLYVRPDLAQDLAPRFTGWLAHANPFAFDTAAIDRTEGSYRFQSGTPNIPALYICQPGLDIISEIGITAIRQRSMAMTNRLIKHATANGWPTTTSIDPEQRGGTVAVDCPHANAVSMELNARDFLVDYRPKAGIRIAPHFYNSDDELDHVIAEMAAILADRAYVRHLR